MRKSFCFTVATLLALKAFSLHAQAFKLVDEGHVVSSIILKSDVGVAHARAAKELAKYIKLVSKAEEEVQILQHVPEQGKYPVFLELVYNDKLGVDGFRWRADDSGFQISANNEQALYYGVYRFLKKYAGIRWLVPGEDGEYYDIKPTISIPKQDTVQVPAFPTRRLEMNCANTSHVIGDSWDWMLRNNYVLVGVHGHVFTTKEWKPELGEALRARAARVANSNMFGSVFTGERIKRGVETHQKGVAEMKRLFAERPDYFPLVKGERVIMRGWEQPCTSNPEVISRMSDHVLLWGERLAPHNGRYAVINDDGTTWCECERCNSLDPVSEKEKNFRSTRYWSLLNQIFAAGLEKYPRMTFGGLAYQNFQTVPDGVQIDPRIAVGLSFNRRCFRHRLEDSDCPTNRLFLDYYKAWGELPNKTYSREEYHAGVGKNFMPSEDSLLEGFKTYKKIGIDGASICTVPPDGEYRSFYDDTVKKGWFCEWQALYLAGEVLWNIDADYQALLEEANSLYYGAGWTAGMKEFRQLLKTTCRETPGCFGWGHGTPVGRVLSQPGIYERLVACLDSAEKATANDERANSHIKREKYLFEITLVKAMKQYLESYRELKSFAKTEPIVLDGQGMERDWKNAEVYSNFLKFKGEKKIAENEPAEYQTFVKIVHEPDHFYLLIEAMEPNSAGIKRVNKAGQMPWGDESLEIFLSHPNFNGSYYQFVFNTNGALYQAQTLTGSLDANTDIDTGIEIKTAINSDRWVAEVKIPTAKLGQNCEIGHTWILNVARNRNNIDGRKEQSSLANGEFHGSFLPLTLVESRKFVVAGEKDTRLWQNPGFNEVFKRPNSKWAVNWQLGEEELLPRGWSLNGPQGEIEMVKHPDSDDYYLVLRKGNLYQCHRGEDKALRYKFRASGYGVLNVMIFRFKRQKYPAHLQTITLQKIKVDSEDWKEYTGDYLKVDPNELIGLVFWNESGEVRIDDAYMFGIKPDEVNAQF